MRPKTMFACAGGTIVLPASNLVQMSREDGGHLMVNPARHVWERNALSMEELTAWDYLVAATGDAMLTTLPQLEGGCINYWDAGNWALNDAAEPAGPKTAPAHRSLHMNLLGRSRFTQNPDAAWGESPRFPRFSERYEWARSNARLTASECVAIVSTAERKLREKFGVTAISPWSMCPRCGYPSTSACTECTA